MTKKTSLTVVPSSLETPNSGSSVFVRKLVLFGTIYAVSMETKRSVRTITRRYSVTVTAKPPTSKALAKGARAKSAQSSEKRGRKAAPTPEVSQLNLPNT